MNIAIIGYGKMGKEVEQVAKERGVRISAIITEDQNPEGRGITSESVKHADVCIDFSTPVAAFGNIEAVARCGKNLVVGTTGWYDKIDSVRELVKEHKIGFLYASNFSLGLNIFSQIVMDISHLIDRYPDYDVAIHETHHSGKVDSPSGTALTLGALVLQSLKRKTEILHETSHNQIKPHQLHVTSSRLGHVTGVHSVVFDSEFDSIELIHRAKSRRGFALGDERRIGDALFVVKIIFYEL